MNKVIVIGTFLPVHFGHEDLVKFALKYAQTTNRVLKTIAFCRSGEPFSGFLRAVALIDSCSEITNVVRGFDFPDRHSIGYHYDDHAPQRPKNDQDSDFWSYWRETINDVIGKVLPNDVIVASEGYGQRLADELGCQFIPYDPYRDMTFEVKGTDFRESADYCVEYFPALSRVMRRLLHKQITLFGAESTGKSTLASNLALELNSNFTIEWARPYLELLKSPDITPERMRNIVDAQYALQLVHNNDANNAFTFQDTDLLSTLGYYKISGLPIPPDIYQKISMTKSDLYIVANSKIPFEPDILRYGGDKRESTDQFWIDILETFGCRYHVLKATDPREQLKECIQVCMDLFGSHPMFSFVREDND